MNYKDALEQVIETYIGVVLDAGVCRTSEEAKAIVLKFEEVRVLQKYLVKGLLDMKLADLFSYLADYQAVKIKNVDANRESGIYPVAHKQIQLARHLYFQGLESRIDRYGVSYLLIYASDHNRRLYENNR